VDWCDFILDVCTCFKEERGSRVIEDFHTLRQTGLQKTPVLSDDSFIASFGRGLKTPFVKALSPWVLAG